MAKNKEILYNSPIKSTVSGPPMELAKEVNTTYSLIRPKGTEGEGVLVLNTYIRR